MKKLPVIVYFISLLFTSSATYSQYPNSGGPVIFKIMDIEPATANYSIATCRSDDGKTIQFKLPQNQNKVAINTKQGSLPLGTQVEADFITGKATLVNNPVVQYKLVKAIFSRACCNISAIEKSFDYSKCYIIAKKDTANGITYFIIRTSVVNQSLPSKLKLGIPIYERNYNGIRYAILKNPDADGAEYMSLSFNFGYMTNTAYNSIPKANNPGSLAENANASQAQTQKLNTGQGVVNAEVEQKPGNLNAIQNKNTPTYEIANNASLKGATGRLILKLPDDADFSIHKVLASGDKKYIGQFFRGDNIGLFPGNYDVYIYGAIVPNVEIQKGMETRIKAGVLNFTDALLYRVYGPNGNTWVEMFKGPKKIGLPVGTYSISVNGQSMEIVIKDGEVTDF
ncbi:MAG: hypothetical protein GC171_11745 [Terrimonas sp.]|nr:hypothetical protein [Terrimonas sp.]